MEMEFEEYIDKIDELDLAISISASKNNNTEVERLKKEKIKLSMLYREKAIKKYGKNASID